MNGTQTWASFDDWVRTANGGEKTTLRQEVDLAVRLFVLSRRPDLLRLYGYSIRVRGRRERAMVEKVLRIVKHTPFRREGLVSWQGIKVGWFLRTFCSSPFMRLVSDFGCEAWFVRKVCIIVLMVFGSYDNVGFDIEFDKPGSFVDNAPRAENPTIFLSYTGGYKWSHVVESLKQLNPKEVMWMDILCVNQFAWTGSARRSRQEEQSRNEFLDDLKEQIESIGRTVLMLGAWDRVMETLGQIWVLWEVFVTSECGDAHLETLLTEEQTTRVEQNFCTQYATKFLDRIDVNNAVAEDDKERRAILYRMRRHGLETVNEKLRTSMRWWLPTAEERLRRAQESASRQLLEEQARASPVGQRVPSEGLVVVETMLRLARKQRELGNAQEAEMMLRRALQAYQHKVGGDHPETLTCMRCVASCLNRELGIVHEPEMMLRSALETFQHEVGRSHPETLICMRNLASFLKMSKKYEEASKVNDELLRLQCDMHGRDSDVTRSTAANLEYCVRLAAVAPNPDLSLEQPELSNAHDASASSEAPSAGQRARGREDASPRSRHTSATWSLDSRRS